MNAELSNIHNSPTPVPKKRKPPNISSSLPSTPKLQSPSTLSYTEEDQQTPKQTAGKKRSHEDSVIEDQPARRPPTFKTPPKYNGPAHPPSQPHLDPIILAPASQDSDHLMQDPFTTSPFSVDWSEEERYYTRLNRIQELLKNLHTEIDLAKNEDSLESILEDEETEGYLIKISSFLPSFTTNSHISPIIKGITDLQTLMGQLNQKIQTINTPIQHDKSLQGSMHAGYSHATSPAAYPPPSSQRPVNHTQQAGAAAKPKAISPNTPAYPTKAPNNPNSSHHPSRLVAQFLPNGISEILRPDPSRIVADINTALESKQASSHLKVVAANFNPQGNLIISTRADQTASELLKFREAILPTLNKIGNPSDIQLREDKKWFKIQIDAVSTTTISITNEHIIRSAEQVHNELLACNPIYAQLQDSLAAKPRWLRSNEELANTSRSSLVFATTDEAAARLVLKQKSLAAFGRHCSLRAFQDRPPITQCRNCWRLDHNTQHCKETTRCRLCSGAHGEEEHQPTNPANCRKCTLIREMGDSMDTNAEGHCPHDMKCLNCLGNSKADQSHPADARRCPARLEKYGTARENERRAQKSDNPWIQTKPKKQKQNQNVKNGQQKVAHQSNRFSVLESPAPTAPIQLSEANALINLAP